MEDKYLEAKNDFDRAIKNASVEDIEKAREGFGISAMKFAMRYTTPDKNQELYYRIYNIYYDFFTNLNKKGIK